MNSDASPDEVIQDDNSASAPPEGTQDSQVETASHEPNPELSRIRQEAAKYRTERNELKKRLEELEGAGKTEIEKLFRDMLGKYYGTTDALTDAFKTFYAAIKEKQLPMAAIVNFLFRHRDKHMDNLKELLDGDSFIKRVTGHESSTKLYA